MTRSLSFSKFRPTRFLPTLLVLGISITGGLFADNNLSSMKRHPDYVARGVFETNGHYSFSILCKPTGKSEWVAEGASLGELSVIGYDPKSKAIRVTVAGSPYVLWLLGASVADSGEDRPMATATGNAAQANAGIQANPRIRFRSPTPPDHTSFGNHRANVSNDSLTLSTETQVTGSTHTLPPEIQQRLHAQAMTGQKTKSGSLNPRIRPDSSDS